MKPNCCKRAVEQTKNILEECQLEQSGAQGNSVSVLKSMAIQKIPALLPRGNWNLQASFISHQHGCQPRAGSDTTFATSDCFFAGGAWELGGQDFSS